MNNRRCVVVCAAEIKDYEFVKNFIKKEDYFIFADGGLKHQKRLNVMPDLIIGDFDSYEEGRKGAEAFTAQIIQLPHEKDDTDSLFSVKEGIKRGFKDFLLLGAIGNRIDHTLVNISILLFCAKEKVNCMIVDDYSRMRLVQKEEVEVDSSCKYFSLITAGEKAEGINIKNAAYPLENGRIENFYQYGISNEVLKNKKAAVSVKEGQLLLIEVYKG